MQSKDDGATPEEQKPNDCPDANGIMHAHAWQWIWEHNKMTDKVRCVNCGLVKENRGEKVGRVLGH